MFVIGPGPDGGASKLKELRAQMPENSGVAAEVPARAGMAIAVAISVANLRPAIMVFVSSEIPFVCLLGATPSEQFSARSSQIPLYATVSHTQPCPRCPGTGDRERRSGWGHPNAAYTD